MKKKILLIVSMVALLICVLAISTSAITQAEADKYYYDKVYVTADGTQSLPIYEKVGDTYYPLVWFAYDVLGEDGTTVLETKYVKARFEDVTMYSQEPNQGRFNGVYYEYTDENGDTIVLNSNHAVLINMRGGVASKTMRANGSNSWTNVTIKTLEWSNTYLGYPSFTKIEAVYFPLSLTVASAPSTARVVDIDRHHNVSISFDTGAFRNSTIKEIFVPGSANFNGGNSQFQWAKSLETMIFGKGFNQNINGYTFQDTSLKRVYWMGTLSELNAITIAENNNKPFLDLTRISLTDYLALDTATQDVGKYLIYDVTECYLYGHTPVKVNDCVAQCSICEETIVNHNENASLDVSIVYTSYLQGGSKITACTNENCTHSVTTEAPALFTCLGYSASENGDGGIAVGYTVNKTAINTYEEFANVSLNYGVFAISQEKLGTGDVFDENGTVSANAISFDVTGYEYSAFVLKIVGFTDAQKDVKLAMGAYVAVNDGEKTTYSYMQDEKKGNSDGRYYFVSYNDIVSQEVVQ